MPVEIPLHSVPSQSVGVILGGQSCIVNIYYRDCLYADLDCMGKNIFRGVRCVDRTGLKLYTYLDFKGQIMFIDTAGTLDPCADGDFSGLGKRFRLVYLNEERMREFMQGGKYL